ncbi:MAG: 2Fe-2S iron-sulfur cluster binding domain-containing protein [Alphaproteobacteria bacterium]|nr:2Fe-2S iron-sulfur cluster binding domain-containing protein [Alphaproteobacteria bacterium]
MLIDAKTKKSAVSFSAQPQEPLLYAGLRAGVALPYECATGTCGTCKARRLSGVLINDWSDAPGRQYLKADREEVLMCQTRALSDCAFEVPGNADLAVAPQPRPGFGSAVVERVERLTGDVASLHLRLDAPLEFEAGQFAALRAPGIPGFRAYSMVNFARPTETVEFVVKRKPDGKFSQWLFAAAAPGDVVEWFGPLGKATFHPHEQRTIFCIAGGSGIASIVSIIEAGCAARHFEAFGGAVFFGVRTSADVFYLDRLSRFAEQFPQTLRITVVLSHDSPSETLRRRFPLIAFESGFPHEIAARDLAGQFAGRVAYLAGPPILVDVAIRMLITQARLPARDIRYDKFS